VGSRNGSCRLLTADCLLSKGGLLTTRLAITGSGGYLAQQLITRLGLDSDVEFILGLDIRPREPKVVCEARFLRFDRGWPIR